MDGPEASGGLAGPASGSLQHRLSAWISAVALLTAIAAGVLSFESAFDESIEFQDDTLRQIAAIVPDSAMARQADARVTRLPASDPESRIVIDVYPREDGARLPGDDRPPAGAVPDGLHDATVDSVGWRVFAKTFPSGERMVVRQRTAVRDEIARDSALRTMLPLVVLIPVLLIVLHVVVRRTVRPLARMATRLDARAEHDLTPLPSAGVPREVLPFVRAINRLLARVDRSIADQRRFVADAAHELRSPLTALSLQAERLADSTLPAPASERLAALRQGIRRASTLVEQLLALARAQAGPQRDTASAEVFVAVRRVLEDLVPVAAARSVDVGVTAADHATVPLTPAELEALIRNLLDNAIRHTPAGARIDLSVRARHERVVLSVEDTGPGIPEAWRDRVFEPFVRIGDTATPGSGLGLAIVKAIADRAGATIVLEDGAGRDAGPGLRVEVTFPSVPAGHRAG